MRDAMQCPMLAARIYLKRRERWLGSRKRRRFTSHEFARSHDAAERNLNLSIFKARILASSVAAGTRSRAAAPCAPATRPGGAARAAASEAGAGGRRTAPGGGGGREPGGARTPAA